MDDASEKYEKWEPLPDLVAKGLLSFENEISTKVFFFFFFLPWIKSGTDVMPTDKTAAPILVSPFLLEIPFFIII